MVPKAKSTRNADLRHAQSIGRQRQAAQRAAADVSTEDLADILPQDASPLLPDAAPVTTPADEAPADMPRHPGATMNRPSCTRLSGGTTTDTSTCTWCAVIISTRCCCTCGR